MSGRQRSDEGTTGQGNRSRRMRREDPQQSGPDRSWQGWLQNVPWAFGAGQQKQGSRDSEKSGGSRSANPMETVERGVKMAYEVVEDYIDQGRQVAQKVNQQQYGPREMGNDLQAVTERMMRDSTRFLSLWFELMGSAMGMAWGGGGPWAQSSSSSSSAKTPTTSRHETPEAPRPRPLGRARVAVEIVSQLAAQVEVELPPGADGQPLHVTPLQCISGDAPQIRGVTFEPGTPARPAVVRLRVPAEQGAGRYYGTMADPESHQSRGRITVTLAEPGDDAETPAAQKTSAKKTPAKKSPAKKGASSSSKSSAKKTSTKSSSTKTSKGSSKKTTKKSSGRKGSS